MPVFKYTGYDQGGSETKGIIEADGQRDAALKIKTRGIFPKEITEAASGKKRVLFKKLSPLLLPTQRASSSHQNFLNPSLIQISTTVAKGREADVPSNILVIFGMTKVKRNAIMKKLTQDMNAG